ncbi:MAG: hypothetical protein KDC46_10810 [Thermoleophilia bacterium]|nr:hypothetical protein [Thermoleophilia bacterium]
MEIITTDHRRGRAPSSLRLALRSFRHADLNSGAGPDIPRGGATTQPHQLVGLLACMRRG